MGSARLCPGREYSGQGRGGEVDVFRFGQRRDPVTLNYFYRSLRGTGDGIGWFGCNRFPVKVPVRTAGGDPDDQPATGFNGGAGQQPYRFARSHYGLFSLLHGDDPPFGVRSCSFLVIGQQGFTCQCKDQEQKQTR